MCGLWWVAWRSEMFFSKHLRSLLPVITVTLLYTDLSFGTGIVGPFEAVGHSLPQLVIQASLVIRDLTLRVFTITRFREKKP